MSDINTERSGSILRVELNRPAKKNAMTAAMYTNLAMGGRARLLQGAHAYCQSD